MSEIQLITITHPEYQRYKQLEQNATDLNQQIAQLKQKLSETKGAYKIVKELTQENNELKIKIRILSKETVRLARKTLEKEDIIAELNQQLNTIMHQTQQSTSVRLEQQVKLIKQQAFLKQSIEILQLKSKQDLRLLQQKNQNDLAKLQKKWKEAQEEISRQSDMNMALKNGINTLKNTLKIKIQEENQIKVKYDLMEQQKERMKKQTEQLNLMWTQKLSQTQKYIAQQQYQIERRIIDLQAENQRLNKQIQMNQLEITNSNQLLSKQIQVTKKIEEQLKLINDQLESCTGQLIIYRKQIAKLEIQQHERQALIEKVTQQNRNLQEQNGNIQKEKKNIMDQLQAWKLLIQEEEGIRWSDLLKSSFFQTELRCRKKVFHFCRQLLSKHLQFSKLRILNKYNDEQDEIILKKFLKQIQNVLLQWQKHINIQSFRHLM